MSHEQRHVQDKARAVVDRAKAAFHSLPLKREHERYAEAQALAAKAYPDWEELFRLELLILQLSSPEALAAQSVTLRSQYDRLPLPEGNRARSDVCRFQPGPQALQAEPLSEEACLRAELAHMLSEVQWDLRKSVELELALEKMRRQVGLGGAVMVALLLVLYCLYEPPCPFPRIVAWAMLFGTLGAITSLFRRMSDPLDVDIDVRHYTPYKNVAMILGNNSDVWFSLFSGPVFALLLVQLFASGLLTGNLFPALGALPAECGPTPAPTDAGNLAKLAVWSFIGGFAETFVPDVLNRLTGRGREQAGLNNLQK